jgi:NAD(P)-dependent dehydrogenase (short-subunit alcohol dehydrogenase family)
VTRLLRQVPAGSLDEVGERLREAFLLVQECMAAATPVVLCVDAPALLGQASMEDAAVAGGLIGLARAVAFEGAGKGWSVTVVALEPGQEPDPELLRLAESVQSLSGQVLNVSAGAVGRVIP